MTAAWAGARRVLCIRLDSLGDVLMTTPALRAVQAGGRRVTLLTSRSGAAVGRMVPEVDEVWPYDAPWLKATAPRDGAVDRAFVERLRAARFDAAIVFTVYSQNPLPAALLAFLADIPLRLAHCRENPYQLLTDWVKEREPEAGVRHEVRRQLDLVGHVGMRADHEHLSLRTCPEDLVIAAAELRRLGVGLRPWVALHAGATASSRRYPPESYAAVVRALVGEHGIDVVLTGAADEAGLVAQIQAEAGVRSHSLAGRLPLGALAAVLRRAALLISNNTGPAHVAAAVGTPVVCLYALTNPQHTPWGVPARVLSRPVPCANCYRSICPEGHHECLRGVAPAAVVSAALELLRQRAAAKAQPREVPVCRPSTS
ncbi:glycosyltransferase family 9 protein [Nannocystis radixulma]|uniref:Glycosyltransferase family 9 protein n=1 Tax=Nannocystis radixulma TaxID=2995305 RepID=A0ABT5BCQ4_9BACT|nr:glycosyltransferase family 9 protein [Nannocystis radixulma]MDC0671919.1 glycosyltransferase family 9 protein [Nannocystis radixulma]